MTNDTLAAYRAEVERRGGETVIAGLYRTEELGISDEAGGLAVLHTAGFRAYSRGHGCHWATLSYLCGTDDNGPWAVRLPGTITTVAAAQYWVTPAAVHRAVRLGRRVRRQGDIYAIEMKRQGDTASGWIGDDWRWQDGRRVTSHWWDAETRYLKHRPEGGKRHRPVKISWPVRFVQQNVYGMGRGMGRGPGD
jgi:hypothetical protein